MCMYIHKQCVWSRQIQWLIWACWSVKSHISRRETHRLLWSEVLAAELRCCSKSCQSASAILHGWGRQDSRADFSVFSYTGEVGGCQHTSAQQHLKAVDFLFGTASRTAFSWGGFGEGSVLAVRVRMKNRPLSGQIQTGEKASGFVNIAAAYSLRYGALIIISLWFAFIA